MAQNLRTLLRWLPTMNRSVPNVVGALAVAAGALLMAAGPAPAQSGCTPGSGPVAVVEVDGLLDRVLVDFIEDQIDSANDDCAVAVVLQLDSGGATVSDGRLDDLVTTIERSDVPVDVWVGPSGSRVTGEAAQLLAAADVTGMTKGTSIEVTPALLAARGVEPTELGDVDVGDRIGEVRAADLGLIDLEREEAPVIGEFVIRLPGVETRVVDGDRQPVTDVRFASLDVVGQRCRRAPRRWRCCCSPCSATASTSRPACPGCGRASPRSASSSARWCSTTV